MTRLEACKLEKPKFTGALTHLGDYLRSYLEAVSEEEEPQQ